METVLPKSTLRTLTGEEMEAYRAPYRRCNGHAKYRSMTYHKDVVAIVEQYGAWLAYSDQPKLFINPEPEAILVGRARRPESRLS